MRPRRPIVKAKKADGRIFPNPKEGKDRSSGVYLPHSECVERNLLEVILEEDPSLHRVPENTAHRKLLE
jgi:hypothetical protein